MTELGRNLTPEMFEQPVHQVGEFTRFLEEPKEPRTNSFGISIGSDIPARKGQSSSSFWIEKLPEGYKLSLNIVDVASGENRNFREDEQEPYKAITISTIMDSEFGDFSYDVGLTYCTSLAVLSEAQAAVALLDPTNPLHEVLSDFSYVSKRLAEDRKLDGSLNFAHRVSKKMADLNNPNNGIMAMLGEEIRDELMLLGKQAIAKKFNETGVLAIYQGVQDSDPYIRREEINRLADDVVQSPTQEKIYQLKKLLRQKLSKPYYSNSPQFQANYNEESHLRLYSPLRKLGDYMNMVILHGILTGENAYSVSQIDKAINIINQYADAPSPLKFKSNYPSKILVDSESTEGLSQFDVLNSFSAKDGFSQPVVTDLPPRFVNDTKKIARIKMTTPNGKRDVIGMGGTYEEARENAAASLIEIFKI